VQCTEQPAAVSFPLVWIKRAHEFFHPPEQIRGVKGTIANYLQHFLTPDIVWVFCPPENTIDFSDIDRGKIICVATTNRF